MTAMVKLRLGDMFDGPSDLIVLPCSTGGTITGFVAKHLQHFKIPHPKARMRLGDVEIMPFKGAENIAQYVAFAASVDIGSSTSDAIERIGEQIGLFTKKDVSVRAIAAPLLGAGAGGLPSETVIKCLRKGFLAQAVPEATITISILHKPVFDRLRENLTQIISSDIPQTTLENKEILHKPVFDHVKENLTRIISSDIPQTTLENKEILHTKQHLRVFISYTASDIQHQEWVKSLATFLRENGVDARLDVWHLRHGMDLPQWMCNELQLANKVIIISNEAYAQKADGRHGGVGWETRVILGDIFSQPPESTKYLVIVRAEELNNNSIPSYLRTNYTIHWPITANENQLKQNILTELFEIITPPPLGQEPIFL